MVNFNILQFKRINNIDLSNIEKFLIRSVILATVVTVLCYNKKIEKIRHIEGWSTLIYI